MYSACIHRRLKNLKTSHRHELFGHNNAFTLEFARLYVSKLNFDSDIKSFYDLIVNQMASKTKKYNKEVSDRLASIERLKLEILRENDHWCRNSLYNALRRHEQKVSPLIHPLPEDKDDALLVLFFLRMPTTLRYLSSLSYMAMSSLVSPPGYPFTESEKSDDLVESFKINWRNHFNGYSELQCNPEISLEVELWSSIKDLSYSHFRANLEVHYPKLRFDIGWKLSSTPHFNPFHATGESIISKNFCKVLSQTPSLQWLVPLPRTEDEILLRENEIICRQCDMPAWIEKKSYLTLANVRSNDNLQLRSLLLLLQYEEGKLDMGQQAVRSIVQQALRQLGPFDERRPYKRLWKSDMMYPSILNSFFTVVSDNLNCLVQKTRDHRSILVYIDVVAWLALFDKRADGLLHRIHKISVAWYTEEEAEINDYLDDAEKQDTGRLLMKQYSVYCILALASVPSTRFTGVEAEWIATSGKLYSFFAEGLF